MREPQSERVVLDQSWSTSASPAKLMLNVRELRIKAGEALALAAGMRYPEAKYEMLNVARRYERLANHTERREQAATQNRGRAA
jgi:hypothetical protein